MTKIYPLWTNDELEVVRQFWPDISKIQALIDRTKSAIQGKAVDLELITVRERLRNVL